MKILEQLIKYNDFVETTALENAKSIPYLVLGLLSEVAELPRTMTVSKDVEKFTKELGDCFWYTVMLGRKTNFDYVYLTSALTTLEVFDESKKRINVTKETKEEVLMNLFSQYFVTIDNLSVESGNIASVVKKVMRDKDSKFEDKDMQNIKGIITTIMNLLFSLHMCANLIFDVFELKGSTLESVLNGNIKKLTTRKKENKLTGSGDNR